MSTNVEAGAGNIESILQNNVISAICKNLRIQKLEALGLMNLFMGDLSSHLVDKIFKNLCV